MQRHLGIAIGLGTQALFLLTVWHLFWFLKGGINPATQGSGLIINLVLSLLFAVPHSALLLPSVRKRLERFVSPSFYGCFYCVVTCVSLLITFWLWRSSAVVLWQFKAVSKSLVETAFIGSWVALFYSLSLTGLGYQTEWTTWWHWLRHKPQPRRVFQPRGAYQILRHPVYLSFLGLLWFTPVMTLDRAFLTCIWTAYIFVGSHLKDLRLAHYLGDTYRDYQALVPGYPGMALGPLARVRRTPSAATRPFVASDTRPVSTRANLTQ
jgi:methanethiol S-methyltransferase